jgi:thiamine-phosphate pyrophosphorylase
LTFLSEPRTQRSEVSGVAVDNGLLTLLRARLGCVIARHAKYNPMKLEFSPALQLAFARARQLAASDVATQVEPRHLLRGLLAEDEGKAMMLLVQSGADVPSWQAHLGLPAKIDAQEPADLLLHPALESTMIRARDLAVLHADEGTISTDHVLLALLTEDEVLRKELEGFGFDHERLQANIVGTSSPLVMDEPLLLEEPAEEIDTARILDASANRSREALRVLEDHARFALDDAFLCRQWKQLRHDLAQAMRLLPESLLLEARDTLHDVGTAISTEQEWQRTSLHAVVQSNVKRLQEALRSLEEYGKTVAVEFAQQIEKIRYQSYTLEGALVQGGKSRERLADAQLYVLVTDSLCRASLVGTVKEAALGGAQIIQLREKDLDDRTFLARAREVRDVTRSSGVLFILNDRPDIARLADADGVHLGQNDLPIREARRILGPGALIGVSTHNLDQVRRAILEGADYIGVGPTFPSQTKDFDACAGLGFVQQALAETSLAAFAIGGIDLDNVAQVRAAGGRRIAVSHAICSADDPRAIAGQLRQALR